MAKIWVPQPATRGYGADGRHPQSVRDELVRQYGESDVVKAELATCLDIMIITGMIKPEEFMYVMTQRLDKLDQQRRAAARLDGDGS